MEREEEKLFQAKAQQVQEKQIKLGAQVCDITAGAALPQGYLQMSCSKFFPMFFWVFAGAKSNPSISYSTLTTSNMQSLQN